MQRAQAKSLIRNASFRYTPSGRGGATGRFYGFDLLNRRWGFDRSTVYVGRDKYLDRWIVYVAGYTLRLHRFWRGDDDRASHTHPWWFITFPLSGYYEALFDKGTLRHKRYVRPFWPHYRPASFEHFVIGRNFWSFYDRYNAMKQVFVPERSKPWWTIVLTGPKLDTWGFYPKPGQFVNWKDWK